MPATAVPGTGPQTTGVTLFYAPEPNTQPNAATGFLANYLQDRSSFARAMFAQNVQNLDPTAKLRLRVALEGYRARIIDSLNDLDGKALGAEAAKNVASNGFLAQIVETMGDIASGNAQVQSAQIGQGTALLQSSRLQPEDEALVREAQGVINAAALTAKTDQVLAQKQLDRGLQTVSQKAQEQAAGNALRYGAITSTIRALPHPLTTDPLFQTELQKAQEAIFPSAGTMPLGPTQGGVGFDANLARQIAGVFGDLTGAPPATAAPTPSAAPAAPYAPSRAPSTTPAPAPASTPARAASPATGAGSEPSRPPPATIQRQGGAQSAPPEGADATTPTKQASAPAPAPDNTGAPPAPAASSSSRSDEALRQLDALSAEIRNQDDPYGGPAGAYTRAMMGGADPEKMKARMAAKRNETALREADKASKIVDRNPKGEVFVTAADTEESRSKGATPPADEAETSAEAMDDDLDQLRATGSTTPKPKATAKPKPAAPVTTEPGTGPLSNEALAERSKPQTDEEKRKELAALEAEDAKESGVLGPLKGATTPKPAVDKGVPPMLDREGRYTPGAPGAPNPGIGADITRINDKMRDRYDELHPNTAPPNEVTVGKPPVAKAPNPPQPRPPWQQRVLEWEHARVKPAMDEMRIPNAELVARAEAEKRAEIEAEAAREAEIEAEKKKPRTYTTVVRR